jgi:hypothetical protein
MVTYSESCLFSHSLNRRWARRLGISERKRGFSLAWLSSEDHDYMLDIEAVNNSTENVVPFMAHDQA